MPLIVRWYLRTALVMFVLALGMGVLQNLSGALPFLAPNLTPVYFHLLMVGWVTQFILGVAAWMLPKYSQEKPRGLESLYWAAYILLNAGLVVRAFAEPLNELNSQSGWGWLLVVSAFLQWLAGLLFVINSWRRVKGK
jgi:peptidoglycan biosynthesis protein MviN/MurJ (putative lipid II flippase)